MGHTSQELLSRHAQRATVATRTEEETLQQFRNGDVISLTKPHQMETWLGVIMERVVALHTRPTRPQPQRASMPMKTANANSDSPTTLAERARIKQFIDAFGVADGTRLALTGKSFAEAKRQFRSRQQLDAAITGNPGLAGYIKSLKIPGRK